MALNKDKEMKIGEEFLSFMSSIDTILNDGGMETGAENYTSNTNTLYTASTDFTGVLQPEVMKLCRKVWDATNCFMTDNNLVAGPALNPASIDTISVESFNTGHSLNGIGGDAINVLCENAGISKDPKIRKQAIAEVALALSHMFNNSTSDSIRAQHFSSARESYNTNGRTLDNFSMMYSTPMVTDMYQATTMPGFEAFGANIDKVITDTRLTIAITLLRFHKSLLNRLVHRRQRATTIVEYEVPYAEVYDLKKSMDKNDYVRLGRSHRTIFLDLYRNPSPVSQKLVPLFPKLENAHGNEVVEDGILANGQQCNLITLSLDENMIGQDHADLTDLVSEGAAFDKLYFTLKKGDLVEKFVFDMGKERMLPTAQNTDSSFRQGNFEESFKMYKGFLTANGTESEILKDTTEENCLRVDATLTGGIRLKDGGCRAVGFIEVHPYKKGNAEPTDEMKALAESISAEVYGYSVYAFYSEENLRRSNIAFRTNKFMRAYEILCGRNYMVDYSLNQVLPEYVMAVVTEGMSLGMDDRAMALFDDACNTVYNKVQEQRKDDGFITDNVKRINFEYVAGTRVNPWIHIDTIDMRNVDTIRSSDFMSDARQYMDTRLTRIISLLHSNSLYRQQLEPGEVPTYKVVTSNIILENLFAMPQIHNHVEQMEKKESDGEVVEYSRMLPSGVLLQCITSPWDRMRNRIIIYPFRPNFPDSELNFAHNWDYGTFLAHYTPQIANGVNKRLFSNAREMPIITNPTAAMLTVAHFDEYIDIDYVASNEYLGN